MTPVVSCLMLTFDRLPITGPCVAYRPPGHAPHVLDVAGVVGDRPRLADVSLWRGLGSIRVERFEGWGRSVVAPSSAIVVTAHDGEPDRPTVSLLRDVPRVLVVGPLRAGRNIAAAAGNHVVLELSEGFVLLAHLRRGSVAVNVGDSVAPGDPLGEVGNSGNSLAPHLHVQAMTSANPFASSVLPWQVNMLHRRTEGRWEPTPGQVPLRVPVCSP